MSCVCPGLRGLRPGHTVTRKRYPSVRLWIFRQRLNSAAPKIRAPSPELCSPNAPPALRANGPTELVRVPLRTAPEGRRRNPPCPPNRSWGERWKISRFTPPLPPRKRGEFKNGAGQSACPVVWASRLEDSPGPSTSRGNKTASPQDVKSHGLIQPQGRNTRPIRQAENTTDSSFPANVFPKRGAPTCFSEYGSVKPRAPGCPTASVRTPRRTPVTPKRP